MLAHPHLVGGTGRLCTDLMRETAGRVLAKIGAEGVYSAAWPELGLGLTLKVEDGDMRSAQVALLGVLARLAAEFGAQLAARRRWPARRRRSFGTRGRMPPASCGRPGDLRFHGTPWRAHRAQNT